MGDLVMHIASFGTAHYCLRACSRAFHFPLTSRSVLSVIATRFQRNAARAQQRMRTILDDLEICCSFCATICCAVGFWSFFSLVFFLILASLSLSFVKNNSFTGMAHACFRIFLI